MKKSVFPIGIQFLLGNVRIVQKRGEGNIDLMLIPKKEPQPINYWMFQEFTPGENKLEMVNNVFLPFNDEREKMLMLCLYNMGIKSFINLLLPETKEELFCLLQQDLKK